MDWLLVPVWFLACVLLGGLALPLTAWLCASLPREGATAALPVGMAATIVTIYWLGKVSFEPAIVLLAVVPLALASAIVARRRGTLPLQAYGEAVAVFALGFGFIILIKAPTAALLPGAENFLNVGLLQSLLRATELPPADMWFAGEPVKYYYGGHLLVASLAKLTGTPGSVAYYLGLATFYGALLSVAYGAGAAIAGSKAPRWFAGGLAAFFVTVASTFYTPIRQALSLLPGGVGETIAGWLDISIEGAPQFYDAAHFTFTNTDFPMYSAFLGTLHAHVMSTVFTGLTIVLLLAYHRTPEPDVRRRRLLLAAVAVNVAVTGLVNTWSLPTGLGLTAVTLTLAETSPLTLLPGQGDTPGSDRLDPARWFRRLPGAVAVTALLGVAALALTAPFLFGRTPRGVGLGIVGAADRSEWYYYLLGYGGFLVAFALYLVPRLRERLDDDRSLRVFGLLGALVLAGWLLDIAGLAIVAPVGIAGVYLAIADEDPGFEAILLVAGAGLVLIVEVFYVVEPAEVGRFNTVYKTFMQAWIIWGVAAGAMIGRVLGDDVGPAIRTLGSRWRVEAVVTLLVLSLSIYGITWTGNATGQLDDGSLTIDGLDRMDLYYPERMPAIHWLANQSGRPTIVSAPAVSKYMYTFNGSPAASLTGIPTVVGWAHERDYREAAAFDQRVTHVDEIYLGTPERRAALLARYDVRFIWVGVTEADRYPVTTIVPADEPWITTAYQRGPVRIYAVNQSALPAG